MYAFFQIRGFLQEFHPANYWELLFSPNLRKNLKKGATALVETHRLNGKTVLLDTIKGSVSNAANHTGRP